MNTPFFTDQLLTILNYHCRMAIINSIQSAIPIVDHPSCENVNQQAGLHYQPRTTKWSIYQPAVTTNQAEIETETSIGIWTNQLLIIANQVSTTIIIYENPSAN